MARYYIRGLGKFIECPKCHKKGALQSYFREDKGRLRFLGFRVTHIIYSSKKYDLQRARNISAYKACRRSHESHSCHLGKESILI
jgi:hypothetical protein